MKRRLTLVLALAMFLLCIVALLTPGLSLAPPDPIYINGDNDLALQAEENGWNGSGTIDDPYVLENLEIDAEGASHSIYIRYVSWSHLVIRNSTFSNSVGAAVELYEVSNLRFVNNTVGGSDGLSMTYSSNIVIENNAFGGPSGIISTSSSSILIANNTMGGSAGVAAVSSSSIHVKNNTMAVSGVGISLDASLYCALEDNGITSGRESIALRTSSENVIHNNTATASASWGISLLDRSIGNLITANDLTSSSGEQGILLDRFCDGNEVLDNNCSGLSQPISLNYASGNTISNNNCTFSVVGISLASSNDNVMERNNCSDAGVGIKVLTSHDLYIDNNVCTNAAEYGILLSSSGTNELMNNNCSWSFRGVGLWSSSNNTISYLLVDGASDVGLYLSSSSGNIISDSAFGNSSMGIYLVSSRENVIERSTFTANGVGLKLTDSSDNNVIHDNDLVRNVGGLILISSDRCLIDHNHLEGDPTMHAGITIREGSLGNTLQYNTISGYWIGANIHLSDGVLVLENVFANEYAALLVEDSGEGAFHGNVMYQCSILLTGSRETFTTQTITADNTVDGAPVYYLANVDMEGATVPYGAGEVILGNVTSGIITGQYLEDGTVGILIGYSINITVDQNELHYNHYGLWLESSSECNIINNVGRFNGYDIYLLRTYGNNVSGNDLRAAEWAGIVLMESSQDIIGSNEVSGAGIGVWIIASDESEVIGNTIGGSDAGIHAVASQRGFIAGNTVAWSTAGLLLEGSRSFLVLGGTFTNCIEGISILESSQNVVDGVSAAQNEYGIYLSASTENTIINATGSKNEFGAVISGSFGNTVANSTFHDNAYEGISVLSSADNIIVGNDCEGNFDGIRLQDSYDNQVANNSLSFNNNGISLDSSYWNVLTNNTCYSIWYGIYLTDSNENELRKNNCSDSYDGIYLLRSRANVLEENICTINDIYGVVLDESDDNILRFNVLHANFNYGVGLLDSDANTIESNDFTSNLGHAMFVESGRDNTILNNIFRANNNGGVQAYDGGTSNHWNTEDRLHNYGNHWSDLTGPDADGIGIVDVPYALGGSSGARDMYPLVFPNLRAPSAPLDLSAERGNGTVYLSWSGPEDNGGTAILNYCIYREQSGVIVRVAVVGPERTYADVSVINGLDYTYWISAVNLLGEGPASNVVGAHPASVPYPPINPTAVGNITTGNITLNWTAPEDGGAEISGYAIYRGTGANQLSLLVTSLHATTYNDTSALRGIRYYYAVIALNVVGEGAPSAVVNATVDPLVPTAPRNLTAVASDSSATLAWEIPYWDGAADITEYVIYRGTSPTNGVRIGNATGLTYVDSTAKNGVTYYYSIKAKNSAGEGASSVSARANPATVPQAPTLNEAVSIGSTVVLTWDAPKDNGGSSIFDYAIYRGTNSADMVLIGSSEGGTSYYDSTATAGVHYYYKIKAVNSVGEGVSSSIIEAKNTKTLAGKVVDADGNGVANATITIDGLEYRTNVNGEFEAEVIPGEGKTVSIRAPGMKDLAQDVDVTIWAEELGTFEMEAGSSDSGGIDGVIWALVGGVAAVVSLLVVSMFLRSRSGKGGRKDKKAKKGRKR